MPAKFLLPLFACLSACSAPAPQQRATIVAALNVACSVDGAVVPVAQPIVASLGSAGATASTADLLVHPAVVAACTALKGIPVSAAPIGSPSSAQ